MQLENQAIENSAPVADQPIEETLTEAIEEKQQEIVSEEVDAEKESENTEVKEKEPDGNDEGEDDYQEDGEEKFPKKAERALERRNKKINKLRAEKAELERRLDEIASRPKEEQIAEFQPEGLKEPQEDDFEDYAEYLVAKGEYKVKREYAAKEAEAQQYAQFESQQKWVQDRAKYVDDRAAKAVESIPELDGLYRENQDIIEGYADTTKMAFLEADKPELAFYALASEGKLESLESMTPTRIAREIALAEIRGEKLSKSRPQSKAPAPIKKAKGTGTRRKTLDDMSPRELLEHLKKSK